jgi:hypothetical protein
LDLIQMTMDLKRQIEQIRCQNCNRANLKFKSAEYADDFKDEKGETIIVDAVCSSCEVSAPVEVSVF